MDVKMDNVSMELLGLRLTFKLPRISIRENNEEEEAEYHLDIQKAKMEEEDEDNKVSYLEWRYGDNLNNIVNATAEIEPKNEVTKMREVPKLKAAMLRHNNYREMTSKITVDDERSRVLRQDMRVVNRLMTVDQIQHIEQWLSDQPDMFPDQDQVEQQTEEDQDNNEDVQDSNIVPFNNFYTRNDRLVYYRKVSIV